MVIQVTNLKTLFDADAYLDEDNDLRLVLTFLTNNKDQIALKTGKIRINDITISREFGCENLIEANIIIRPDKVNNLFTMEKY